MDNHFLFDHGSFLFIFSFSLLFYLFIFGFSVGYIVMLADEVSWDHKSMGRKTLPNVDYILVSRIISTVKRKPVILRWK